MPFLSDLDTQLFLSINHLPHNLFFDLFFGFLTLIGSEGIIWLAIAAFLFWQRKDKKIFLPVSLAFFISITVEFLLKNLIRRPRPQFVVPTTMVLIDFTHSFSFPSGHAMLAFACAYILGIIDKKNTFAYYLLAVLISFSRVYLGQHYPSDVLAGAIFGVLIGFLSLKIVSRFKLFKAWGWQ